MRWLPFFFFFSIVEVITLRTVQIVFKRVLNKIISALYELTFDTVVIHCTLSLYLHVPVSGLC